MAANLRKYKYSGSTSTRPEASGQSASSRSAIDMNMDFEVIKADILSSLKSDISSVIKQELKNALAEDFDTIKSELQAMRSEIASSAAATRSEIDQMKENIKDVEGGLSTWSDEMVTLQATVTKLTSQVDDLKEKCEDMEGRMQRGNIRITGVPEQPGSSSPAAVSKLLREVLEMDRDVKIDRSHRSLVPRKPGDKPRTIIAKLHYDGDCMEILRKARERAPLNYNGNQITIFPDYTASVAKARAAFGDVRRALRGRQGVRYGLLFPARLRISYDGEEKEFRNASEAMDYVKRKIISVTQSDA